MTIYLIKIFNEKIDSYCEIAFYSFKAVYRELNRTVISYKVIFSCHKINRQKSCKLLSCHILCEKLPCTCIHICELLAEILIYEDVCRNET